MTPDDPPCPYCKRLDKVFVLGSERRYCIRCKRFYVRMLAKSRQYIDARKTK
jgi:hypothetical protein